MFSKGLHAKLAAAVLVVLCSLPFSPRSGELALAAEAATTDDASADTVEEPQLVTVGEGETPTLEIDPSIELPTPCRVPAQPVAASPESSVPESTTVPSASPVPESTTVPSASPVSESAEPESTPVEAPVEGSEPVEADVVIQDIEVSEPEPTIVVSSSTTTEAPSTTAPESSSSTTTEAPSTTAPESSSSTTTEAANCPRPAINVIATPGNNEVTVEWTLSSFDDSSVNTSLIKPTSAFIRLVDTISSEVMIAGMTGLISPEGETLAVPTSARVVGLSNGVEYSVSVITATSDGAARASEPITVVPTDGMEGVVAGVIVSFADGALPEFGSNDVPGGESVEGVALTVGEKVSDDAVLVEFSEAIGEAEAREVADALEADPAVDWAEPDMFLFTSTTEETFDAQGTGAAPSDSSYEFQWNLWGDWGVGLGNGIEALTSAWDENAGTGVTIAVIDTGIVSHPDLDAAVVPGYDFVSASDNLAAPRTSNGAAVSFDGDYVDTNTFGAVGRDSNPSDPGDWRDVTPVRSSSWHGTEVAGVIAAQANNGAGIAGVAPGSRIQPIRALSWRGGLLSDIAAGITWASGGTVDGVPSNANPSSVLNLSFSVKAPCPTSLQSAIDGALGRGSIVIAAAGNAASDASSFTPGNCSGVITVGATDSSGKRSGYSNHGAVVDMSAPGSAVTTLSNDGDRGPGAAGTRSAQGTSIAAAHVSAAAARYISSNPAATPAQVSEWLTGEAVRRFAGDTCDDAVDVTCGTGILNLAQVASGSITVTYFDPRTEQSYSESVDPAAFTPASASTVGFTEGWSNDIVSNQKFATWVLPENCSYYYNVQRCTGPAAPFFDPGVEIDLTSLSDYDFSAGLSLYAVFREERYLEIRCPSGNTIAVTSTIVYARYRIGEGSIPDPIDSEADGGCVGWASRFDVIASSYRNATSGAGGVVYTDVVRVTDRGNSSQLLIAQSSSVSFKVLIDTDGATWNADPTANCTGYALRGYATLPCGLTFATTVGSVTDVAGNESPTGTWYTQFDALSYRDIGWNYSLTKTGYTTSNNALPYWTIGSRWSADSPTERTVGWIKTGTYQNQDFWASQGGCQCFLLTNISQADFGTLDNRSERVFTMFANHLPSATVMLDTQGGTASHPDTCGLGPFTVSFRDTVPLRWCSYPVKDGVSFTGWNSEADGSGDYYPLSPFSWTANSDRTTSEITLYAQYSTNAYPLYFDANGGETSSLPTTINIPYKTSREIPAITPTREGYSFASWNTAANGSGTTYAIGDEFVNTSTLGHTLYAIWVAGYQTVSFDLNDQSSGSTLASGAPGSVTGASDAVLTLPDDEPTRTGYDFDGWNTAANGSGTSVAAGGSFTLSTSDVTLYAQWSAKTYTVTQYTKTGTVDNTYEADFDSSVALNQAPASPSPGRFLRWNTEADGSGTDYSYTSSSVHDSFAVGTETVPESGSIIALYPIIEYPVLFRWQDPGDPLRLGQTTQYVTSYVSVTDVRVPSLSALLSSQSPAVTFPSLTGWSFSGWVRDGDELGLRYGPDAEFEFPSNVASLTSETVRTFDALWTPRVVRASFNANGGSTTSAVSFYAYDTSSGDLVPAGSGVTNVLTSPYYSSTFTYNGSFTVPAATTRTGYEFKEWNTASNCAGTGIAPGATYVPADALNAVLTACWKTNQTITFNSPGNQTLSAGSAELTAPTASSELAVTLISTTTPVCTVSGSTLTFVKPGSCTLTASQSGDDDYAAADDVSHTVTISADTQQVSAGDVFYHRGPPTTTSAGVPVTNGASGGETQIQYSSGDRFYLLAKSRNAADSQYTQLPLSFASITPEVCTVSATDLADGTEKTDTDGESDASGSHYWAKALVTEVSGGLCSIVISQDGRNSSGAYTHESDSVQKDIYLASAQTVTFDNITNTSTNTPVIPYIPSDGTRSATTFTVETTSSSGNELVDIGWVATTAVDSWSPSINPGVGPNPSTVCGDNSTVDKVVRILTTGRCLVLGKVPEADLWLDTQFTGGLPPATYLIVEGFWIDFDANYDGGSDPAGVAAALNADVVLPTLSRSYFTFDGWNTAANGSGTSYSAGTVRWQGSAALTLYAEWTPIEYPVTFNSNGGSSVTSSTFVYGGSVAAPTAPTRAGYTFDGWFTTPSGGSALTFPYSPGGSSAVTLYAQWTAETHTVTFNSQGGSSVADGSFSTGGTVAKPADPTRLGYTFDGWSLTALIGDAITWTSDTYAPNATDDLTLYALWSSTTYRLYFNSNGGEGTAASVTATHEGSVTLPGSSSFSRFGYTFAGWSRTSSGSAAFAAGTATWSSVAGSDSANHTLYAVWTFDKLAQTITFAPLLDVEFIDGRSISVTKRASSGLSTSMSSNTTSVCTTNGVTVTLVAVGTCSLTVSQSGDDVYEAATSVTRTFESSLEPLLVSDTEAGSARYVNDDGTLEATPLRVSCDGTALVAGKGPNAQEETCSDFADTPTRNGEEVIDMQLEGDPDDPDSATLDPETATLEFVTGRDGLVTGKGFKANTVAEIWIFSIPTFLGYANVGADGTFAEFFTVPEALEDGRHTIQAEGLTIQDTYRAVNAGVKVLSLAAPSPGPSPSPGAPSPNGPGSPSDTTLPPPTTTIPSDPDPDPDSPSTTLPQPSGPRLPITGGSVSRRGFFLPIIIGGFLVLVSRCRSPRSLRNSQRNVVK